MSKLTAVANVFTILTGLLVMGWLAVSAIRAINLQAAPGYDKLESRASTGAEHAELTFTNLGVRDLYACVQAKVTNKAGNSTESVVVCTGDIKAHSTVHIQAPYKVGAVLDLCNKPGGFGKTLDWSECNFTVSDRTSATVTAR
ncbi:MAG: hypothetical protein EOO70_07665 [Myxococcaceae bacterium]|nr:MAG: hypothetical protein EOO70_07665 [Myxococcaceae bacterium]